MPVEQEEKAEAPAEQQEEVPAQPVAEDKEEEEVKAAKKPTTKKPANAAKKAEKPAEKKTAKPAAKPAEKKAATPAEKKAAKPVEKAAAPVKTDEAPNNYILLTDEPAKPAGGRYVIIKDDENPVKPYKFQLKANNGQVLFESEGYKVKPKKASIMAFKKAVEQGTIAIDKEKNGTYRYKLFKADGSLLGVGESYSAKARAESSADSVKTFAASANFIEDLTVTE